jgi:hypothetical protein
VINDSNKIILEQDIKDMITKSKSQRCTLISLADSFVESALKLGNEAIRFDINPFGHTFATTFGKP